ncbi:hypothetical protein SMD44_07358 [Streptomyces alboflavus]|uniref:Integral membrane protein n=1 Tax=Streptomyces alboflavus TaxID=67267 RepID=A0A1Z1WN59_9ACTN|nr:hypothetical protein [Streptomyces alboflavus]ARX87876.1 hypothetical protein SMD44_07358 [Streptomyces alboflavus]
MQGDLRAIRQSAKRETERAGSIWAACGLVWLIATAVLHDVAVLGTVMYWGIYVGAVVSTVLLVRAIMLINRRERQQIDALKKRGGF